MLKIVSLLFIVLFLSASFAQISTPDERFRVLENETRLVLADKTGVVSLAVDNPSGEFSARVKLEIVAPNDDVQAAQDFSTKIGRGRQILTLPVDTSKAVLSGDTLLWYRLRYEIVPESAAAKTVGVVSFSRILPEVFELRMIAGIPVAENRFRVRVQAFDPATQKMVAGVALQAEIEIEDRDGKLEAVSKTDAGGLALLDFELPDFETARDVKIRIVGEKNGLRREVKDRLDGLAQTFGELITDKPLYQPSQTLNSRLYLYDQNRLPVKDRTIDVEIENDDSDEIVFSEKLKTSRFGIAAFSWKIPETVKLGEYRIRVKMSEDYEIAGESVKITRYELPNFYVEARPDRSFYLPDQKTARVEISARYLFGKVLPAARVRLVPTGSERDAGRFKELTGTLDDDGKFSAEIDLTEAFENFEPESYRRYSDFRFSAYITDPTTNRTESRSFDVRITDQPIHVYVSGKTYNQSSRLPLDFYVSTFYADGSPAVCEVGIYETSSEDGDRQPVVPEISRSLGKLKTSSYGAARVKLPPAAAPEGGDLNLLLTATDAKGLTGSAEREIDFDDDPALRVETDKTIYRKGEPVRVSIISSEKQGAVLLDAVKRFEVLSTTAVRLENGRAELVLPYRQEFKNDVQLVASFESDENELVTAARSVIYPTPTNLEIDARTSKEVYRPGEQASVKFRSRSGGGKSFAQAALGVLVIDKAVEDRARSEGEVGGGDAFLNRTFTSRLAGFFGRNKIFGDLTEYDIKNIDASKPVSPELQLAVEIGLGDGFSRLEMSRSRAFREDLDTLFTPHFRAKMKPLAAKLDELFESRGIYPRDPKELREILKTEGIDLDALEDAWGNPLRAEFRLDREALRMSLWSAGADELSGTADDLTVLETERRYFMPIGKAIDRAMREYTERTGGFIQDYPTLRAELRGQNIDADGLRDPWGGAYRFEFTIDRTNYLLTVRSSGADRRPDVVNLTGDDFTLWTHRADYFTATRANLIKNFNDHIARTKSFPGDPAEMRAILLAGGFDLDTMKDAYGRAYYIQQRETAGLSTIFRYRDPDLKVVKQKLLTFAVRSAGADGIAGNYDDFELASFTGATLEREVDVAASKAYRIDRTISRKAASGPNGAITVTIVDPNGAVVPNAAVTLSNNSRTVNRTVMTDPNGFASFDDLPPDVYTLTASGAGFRVGVITNLTLTGGVTLDIVAALEVGSFDVNVTVTTDTSVSMDTSDTKIDTNISLSRFPSMNPQTALSFTPRVRDYFVETLVWLPELVTDKKGGAALKFKMADNLTTWKLYAIGSDENGDFGVVEKELQTFQPFFAELDPPRVLTTGDRIDLPVPLRNYTNRKKKVAVALDANGWSRVSGGAAQNLEVPANASANAIFSFEAIAPVLDGRQRVTARAGKDGDALEKPVTVRPNGRETVETASKLFEKETVFDVGFPPGAFPNARRAEVKIYPNLLAHVVESVEGLLKRPSGCGEQTTSSTYPNLLILKIEKEMGKEIDPRVTARAQSYLAEGYERLLNYQTAAGGFSYWGKTDTPNVALTAYVLRFLTDAEDFIEVDETVVEKAENWLLNQQKADGSWDSNSGSAALSTAYAARALSLTADSDPPKQTAVRAAIEFLRKRPAETDDAFVLANLALAAQAIGDAETARTATERLSKLSSANGVSLFWSGSKTPFYGWGKAADVETTALAVQALLKAQGGNFNEQIAGGLSFLLKNKDRFGVWYSTQTTVNVLDALILLQKMQKTDGKNKAEKIEILIDGVRAREFEIAGAGLSNPIVFDASPFLTAAGAGSRLEIKTTGSLNLAMAQLVLTYYVDWRAAREESRYFDFQIEFDRLQAKIGEEISCRVRARKKIDQSGMILTEIGLPPGAEVDRASLEKAKSAQAFSSYDVLPDRVVVYSWASAAPLDFSFKFRPRYGLDAQTAPSIVYDYYNDEARATVAPFRFTVK